MAIARVAVLLHVLGFDRTDGWCDHCAVPSLLTVTVGFTTIDSYPLSVSSFVVCAGCGANHR